MYMYRRVERVCAAECGADSSTMLVAPLRHRRLTRFAEEYKYNVQIHRTVHAGTTIGSSRESQKIESSPLSAYSGFGDILAVYKHFSYVGLSKFDNI